MKSDVLTKKEELALQVGMQFDEVSEIFSVETLNSMTMMHIIGGEDDEKGNNSNCTVTNGNCICVKITNCSCPSTHTFCVIFFNCGCNKEEGATA